MKVLYFFIFCAAILLGNELNSIAQTSVITFDTIRTDGGICTLNDTITFWGKAYSTTMPSGTFYLVLDYGNNHSDTLHYSNTNGHVSAPFVTKHQYASLSNYTLKLSAYLNNTIVDSFTENISLGNCQKASGSFFYDLNNNCLQDSNECGINHEFVNFYNNGNARQVYIEPYTGKFSIPVYTGDSYLPQTSGFLDVNDAYIGSSCSGTSYSPIISGVSNYLIRAIPNNTATLNLLSGPELSCTGIFNDYYFNISSSASWYVREDWGEGYGEGSIYYTTNGGYTSLGHIYFNPGVYRVTFYGYSSGSSSGSSDYGPLTKASITVTVNKCDTVILNPFIDGNANCLKDTSEGGVEPATIEGIKIPSAKWHGQCYARINNDGTIFTLLQPNDTIFPDTIGFQGQFTNNYPGQYFYYDSLTREDNCGPAYLTNANANDTIDLPYNPELKILSIEDLNPSYIRKCWGDTIKFNLYAASLGLDTNTHLLVISKYSDGFQDTLNILPNPLDAFSVPLKRTLGQYDSATLHCTFIILDTLHSLVDTAMIDIGVNNCSWKKIKVFYDQNKNCIKDTNENYVTHFSVHSNSFYAFGSSSNNDYCLFMVDTTVTPELYVNYINLSSASNLGAGYYYKTMTEEMCNWPSLIPDTTTLEIPLVDSIALMNADLRNGTASWSNTNDMLSNCDSVYNPILIGNVIGNRNHSHPYYFAYNSGDGSPYDTMSNSTFHDYYNDSIAYYSINAPATVYAPGYYYPGYKLIGAANDTEGVYIRPWVPLNVLLNCQRPKAILFNDNNNNCVMDSLDNPISNVMVHVVINGQNQYVLSSYEGYVNFIAYDGDSVTITVPNIVSSGKSINTGCTPQTYGYVVDSSNSLDTIPFAYNCAANSPTDVSLHVSHSLFSPFINDTILLTPGFTNCATNSGRIIVSLDSNIHFIDASLAGFQQTGNTITWNLDTLNKPGIYPLKIAVNVANAPMSTWFCSQATIFADAVDADSSNNVYTLCDSIKIDLPIQYKSGTTDSIYLETGKPISYIINFKNNTADTIRYLMIVDTITPLLDMSSFQLLYQSLPFTAQVNTGNVLVFSAPFIQLLPGESGSVQFALTPSGMMAPGTVIYNNAVIVMDSLNITQSNQVPMAARPAPPADTTNGIHGNPPIQNLNMVVYPNPAQNSINVSISGDYGQNGRFILTDASGKILKKQNATKPINTISIKELSAGMYILSYHDSKWNRSIKVVKTK